jgi:radical SAM superfamily enzyme YgiQ (UPF0313 family)
MKILIIQTKETLKPNQFFPLGSSYISAILKSSGHEVDILDLNFLGSNDPDIVKEKLQKSYNLIGISGMITGYKSVLEVSSYCKKNSESVVVIGGPISVAVTEELMENSSADFLVLGEGEETILELCYTLSNGKAINKVKGLCFRDKKGKLVCTEPRRPNIDLDRLPFPDREGFDIEFYIFKNDSGIVTRNWFGDRPDSFRMSTLITSRGCPYNCIYCDQSVFGKKWRGRSAENIVDELEMLQTLYNINAFVFLDDTFVIKKKRVMELCQEIKKRGLALEWGCNGRANLMDEEMMVAMKEAGCVTISYGIETGNKAQMEFLKRGVTVSQIAGSVRLAKKLGYRIKGYFMINHINETIETLRETTNFAKGLDLDFASCSILTPYPNTELYEIAKKERGFDKKEAHWTSFVMKNAMINLTRDLSLEQISKFQRWWPFEVTRKTYPLAFLPRGIMYFVVSLYYEYEKLKLKGERFILAKTVINFVRNLKYTPSEIKTFKIPLWK